MEATGAAPIITPCVEAPAEREGTPGVPRCTDPSRPILQFWLTAPLPRIVQSEGTVEPVAMVGLVRVAARVGAAVRLARPSPAGSPIARSLGTPGRVAPAATVAPAGLARRARRPT